jgi:hypothetical protein
MVVEQSLELGVAGNRDLLIRVDRTISVARFGLR